MRISDWSSDVCSSDLANASVEQFDRRTGSSTQGLEERSTISQSERVSGRHDRQAQISDQIGGALSAGLGGRRGGGNGGSGGRGLPGLGINVSKSGSQMDTMTWKTEDSRRSEERVEGKEGGST